MMEQPSHTRRAPIPLIGSVVVLAVLAVVALGLVSQNAAAPAPVAAQAVTTVALAARPAASPRSRRPSDRPS